MGEIRMPPRTTMAATRVGSAEAPADRHRGRAGEVTIVAHDIGPVGGMERQLSELLIGLRALGHRVTVIARSCELPEGSGVVFHRVRAPGRPLSRDALERRSGVPCAPSEARGAAAHGTQGECRAHRMEGAWGHRVQAHARTAAPRRPEQRRTGCRSRGTERPSRR